MSEERSRTITKRWSDNLLLVAAIAGPLAGFICGTFKAGARIQVIDDDHNAVVNLLSWKDKEEEFNKVVIQQIATLQAQHRH